MLLACVFYNYCCVSSYGGGGVGWGEGAVAIFNCVVLTGPMGSRRRRRLAGTSMHVQLLEDGGAPRQQTKMLCDSATLYSRQRDTTGASQSTFS